MRTKSLAREVVNLELFGSQPHFCVGEKSKEQIVEIGGLKGQLPPPMATSLLERCPLISLNPISSNIYG